MEEKYFSRFIDRQEGDITVDYAADLPSDVFGSGFPTKPGEAYADHPWNLNNLRRHEGSLLSFFGKDKRISGITLPWVYMGMKWSSFCWHYEDLSLWSVNYMHVGGSKVWYSIPAADRKKFDRVVKEKLACLHDSDPNFLLDIIVQVSPAYLTQHGIRVFRTEQRPGEFIFTFPEGYHAGFSTGFNVAEACNFATESWLDWGQKCNRMYLTS